MAKIYNPNDFIKALSQKINNKPIKCPYCGKDKFTSTNLLANILVGNETSTFSIGQCIPSGMLICQNCGHVEFFALGTLGLLELSEGKKIDDEKTSASKTNE